MPKLLITGGAGFIGVNSAIYFLRRGWRIVVLDNFSRAGSRDNLAWLQKEGEVTCAEVDVRDFQGVRRTIEDHPDLGAVLHLAAQVAVTRSVQDPQADCAINVMGTVNVLESIRAAGINPAFIYASTNKVYGSLHDAAVVLEDGRYALTGHPRGIAEGYPLDFHSPYGCSKGAADMYVLDYARIHGLRTVSLRQSCIYGYRQFGTEDQGWLAWFTICHLLGRPVTIFGDGKQVRDVLFISDLVACYERCIEFIDAIRGRAFNIGGGPENTLSLLELVALLEKRFRRRLHYSLAAERPGDQRVYVSCPDKAERLLGWRPQVGLEEGLEKLFVWIQEHRSLIARQFPAQADNGIDQLLSPPGCSHGRHREKR